MSEEKPTGGDILGIKPFGDAVLAVTNAAIAGASAVLGRICLPAAAELGEYFRDRVHAWRTANMVAILEKTKIKLESNHVPLSSHAHPRIVGAAMQDGGWSDDETIQDMWAGLLASSCVPDGRDDSNWVFTGVLSQLTALQAAVVKYSCEKTPVIKTQAGLIMPAPGGAPRVNASVLKSICRCEDLDRIDIELDRLRDLGLIQQGFTAYGELADISATAFALNMYVRCQGYSGSALEFFAVSEQPGVAGD